MQVGSFQPHVVVGDGEWEGVSCMVFVEYGMVKGIADSIGPNVCRNVV